VIVSDARTGIYSFVSCENLMPPQMLAGNIVQANLALSKVEYAKSELDPR